jgi:hypothetical protein
LDGRKAVSWKPDIICWKRRNKIRKELQSKERENHNAINDREVFPKRLTRIELFERRKERGRRGVK